MQHGYGSINALTSTIHALLFPRESHLATDIQSPFSPDYSTARRRFLSKCKARGAAMECLPISAKGPQQTALSVDIAWLGNPNAKRVILHSSGLHGIEGFAGSAIQLDLLDNLPEIPEDGAIVLVHILNPYGMAWLRRVNESNVDLNRNFLGDNEVYGGAPKAYELLDSTLNPPTPPSFDFFLLRTLQRILRHGYNSLKQSIVGGQYQFEKGLFFGGSHMEEGPLAYSQWIQKNLSNADYVVGIDIHTGLGKYGEDTLLVEGDSSTALYQEMEQAFGSRVAPWDAEESVAYAIRGGHPGAVVQNLPESTVHFVTQEFGTLAPLKVLHALREENRWHHWGDGTLDHPTKKRLLDAFRPDKEQWRESILTRGREVALQAVRMAFDSNSP